MTDSHAHYTHIKFAQNNYKYLVYRDGSYTVKLGGLGDVIREIKESGITAVIEPAIGMESNEKILKAHKEAPDFVYPAAGLHPACCRDTDWRERKALERYASYPEVIAIGETGLDYFHGQGKKEFSCQKRWFVYQIKLAHRKKLPLILHIRDADSDGLKILKRYRGKLHSGVAHCFKGDTKTAKRYIGLGFYIGIGGHLLREGEHLPGLTDAVKEMPLERILLETDSPYMNPDCADPEGRDISKDYRNTSTVIFAVAERIAALKGIPVGAVLEAAEKNVRALFGAV